MLKVSFNAVMETCFASQALKTALENNGFVIKTVKPNAVRKSRRRCTSFEVRNAHNSKLINQTTGNVKKNNNLDSIKNIDLNKI
jgi:hypothetical protein